MHLALEHTVDGNPSSITNKATNGFSGAPETYRAHEDTESAPLRITPSVDMWSLGCVFSEAAVWIRYGWKRLVEYRRQRTKEIEEKADIEGEHIFHHEGNLLDAVENIHQEILRPFPAHHHITRSLLERLVDDMLQHGQRPRAKEAFEKSKRLISKEAKRFGVSLNPVTISQRREHEDPDYHRDEAPRETSEGSSVPPDDDWANSPSTPRPQPSPHRHHHPTASGASNQYGDTESSKKEAQVTPDPPRAPPTPVENHEPSRRVDVNQRAHEQDRPTLSISEGHDWKERKKNGEYAVLRGSENLTSLNKRDHVGRPRAYLEQLLTVCCRYFSLIILARCARIASR